MPKVMSFGSFRTAFVSNSSLFKPGVWCSLLVKPISTAHYLWISVVHKESIIIFKPSRVRDRIASFGNSMTAIG